MSAVVYIPWKFIIQGKTVDVEGPLILDDPELAVSAVSRPFFST
jgi:hypothetical protein